MEKIARLSIFRYLRTNRPVVVRNVSLDWEAMKVLDYSWLKTQYTKNEEILEYKANNCFFKCYKTEEFPTLASVFTMSEERVSDVLSRPWYVGWSVCHKPVVREIEKLSKSGNSKSTFIISVLQSSFQSSCQTWTCWETCGYL